MTGVDIDDLPATSFPVLEDMSPVLQALPPGKSLSWGTGNSQDVFKRATDKCAVRLDTRVRQVLPIATENDKGWCQSVVDDKGHVETFDRVVMACPAHAAANIV